MKLRAVSVLLLIVASPVLRAAETAPADPVREANRAWLAGLPAAPKPELTRHGLVAEELRRWRPRGANQGVAVDAHHFYGIGGATIHLNGGLIQDGQLVLAHSNFPQLPMASSLEYFDPVTVQPVKSVSLGIRHGSLTWAEKKDGFWWACFAHYNDQGTAAGTDNRSTLFGKFDDQWNVLESWIFPAQVVTHWGKSSSSGGSWGDDGLLYTTGHDEKELYVLRLPKMGVALEYVTTIEVPFEGQSWAWDRSDKRIIYGIIRRTGEVVVARIPELPKTLLTR